LNTRGGRLAASVLLLSTVATTAPFASAAQSIGTAGRVDPIAPHEIDYRLLLIGDAGAPHPDGEPALHALNARARELPGKTTAVFLGDNVYETGMPERGPMDDTAVEEVLDEVLLNLYESRADAEKRLNAQIVAVTAAGANAVFVPGNHDWDQFGVGGWDRVKHLGTYIAELQLVAESDIVLAPAGGCPGPVVMDLGTRLRLIAIDTQWWLTPEGGRPSPEENPTGCPHLTETAVRRGLEHALLSAGDRESVVVAHHPIQSIGPHGGHFPWHVHLFPIQMLSSYVPFVAHWIPLPVLGSAMVWSRRWLSPSVQDFSHPANRRMREDLVISMEIARRGGRAPLIFAAGHDHSLQVFEERFGPDYSLVSGLGSSAKASQVGDADDAIFAHSDGERPGLMELDVAVDGRVRLAVFVWDPDERRPVEVFARDLTAERPRTSPVP